MRFNFVFAVIASITVTITAMPHANSDANHSLMPRNLPQEANLNPRATFESQGGVLSGSKLYYNQYDNGGGNTYSDPTKTSQA
ncbi:uncharacterized protein MELLADRAFT_89167 [Melampsora larici-populina 98AG31]|uniref:Secreted protein n=1 Tax=Melampsora larici-populina (strain 98AG31 / pathotype 3-4-7) TaxID=747676 RepID=F4R577_MELLP|nr:uncharacterized protein MELLADRAFT_89167 [Melampsora larici-populina 98AG31]EGG11999.1 secreted protein [Melampsora larici-populina 98AG31]